MRNNIVITIPQEGLDANMTFNKPDGTIEQKTVSINDIISGLASSHRFSTGLLPKGTRAFSGSISDYTISIETLSIKRFVRYDGRRIEIPMPVCLFTFYIKDCNIYKSTMFSSVRPLENENNRLYSFPFGNIYSSGEICWGSVNLPRINRPMELVGIINTFFSSEFNGDLFDGERTFRHPTYENNEYEIEGLGDLINYVSSKEVFPVEILKETSKVLRTVMLSGE